MQMIASLAASNQASNERMEKQMNLNTNLQQTVADLVIRVSDRESDASTITSNEQRKRRLPHHSSKSSMQKIHPNDAGNLGQSNAPPDPAPIHDGDNNALHQSMSHPEDHMDTNSSDASDDENMSQQHSEPTNNDIQDVNGGINDDDLINMMARDATNIHMTHQEDHAPSGPYGTNDTIC